MTKKLNSGELEVGFEVFPVQGEAQSIKYSIILDDTFQHPRQFVDAVEVVSLAEEHDTIIIRLNSGGGSLDAVMPLLYAMQNCQAHIHCIASGTVASAATMVLLSCDSFELDKYTSVLVHSPSYGIGGKESDVKAFVDHTTKLSDMLMNDIYSPYFSEEEMLAIRSGREFYLLAEELGERYEAAQRKMAEQEGFSFTEDGQLIPPQQEQCCSNCVDSQDEKSYNGLYLNQWYVEDVEISEALDKVLFENDNLVAVYNYDLGLEEHYMCVSQFMIVEAPQIIPLQ